MDKSRRCPRCGEDRPAAEFGTRPYCPPCFNSYARERRLVAAPTITCTECGLKVRKLVGRQLVCSAECGQMRTRRLRGSGNAVEIDCAQCGVTFMQRRSNSRYCTVQCFDMSRYEQRSKDPAYAAQRAAYASLYHIANRERRLMAGAEWRAQNREAFQAVQRRWAESNRERIRAYRSIYRRANLKKFAAKQAIRNERMRQVLTIIPTDDQMRAKLAYWGNRCWMCGEPADTIDHVKPICASGPHILANMRPACRSCNSSKHSKWFGPNALSMFIRQ